MTLRKTVITCLRSRGDRDRTVYDNVFSERRGRDLIRICERGEHVTRDVTPDGSKEEILSRQ